MNSSSIVMAYICAGILSLAIHHVVVGPIVFGPSQVTQHASADKKSGSLLERAKSQQLSARVLKMSL